MATIKNVSQNLRAFLDPSFRTCLKHYQSLDSDRLL